MDWLNRHGVIISEFHTKQQLLMMCDSVPYERNYVVDDIVKEHGHFPIHLPPYHPELNPIELVWGDIKRQVEEQGLGSNLSENEALVRKLFEEYPREKWQKFCEHTKKIEGQYFDQEYIMDEEMERIVILLHSDSSTSDREGSGSAKDL